MTGRPLADRRILDAFARCRADLFDIGGLRFEARVDGRSFRRALGRLEAAGEVELVADDDGRRRLVRLLVPLDVYDGG